MIDVQHVCFTYAGRSAAALHDLSFTIERGEIFGFLGPSGAGKSTTQKILIGLLKGYAGHARVLGKDLSAWKSDYYERIGVSFEHPNHFLKLTALENLSYFGSLYSRPCLPSQELLELVGLEHDGTTQVGQFSKGMKNRLSVARALLHRPELLFLDEPTSGLDPANAHRIKELIRAQCDAGTTIFLTTHDMAVADTLCDRVAFIMDGHIRLINSPRALKLTYGSPTVQVEYGHNGQTTREAFPLTGLSDNRAFLHLLQSEQVQTIHSQEASLEDIFMQVTGRRITV